MKGLLRILILEDNVADVEMTQRAILRAGITAEFRVVNNEKDYRSALGDFTPDVILSDHSLPQFDSLQALEIFRGHQHRCAFILVTGAVSEEFAVKVIKSGANDYLLKSNLSRLPNAILSAVRQIEADRKNKEVVEERDTFLYRTSHDLKGPVASMLGLANLGIERVKDPEAWQYFQMIREQAGRMNELLDKLLEVARLSKTERQVENIDLKALVSNVLGSIAFMEGFGKVAIHVDASADLVFRSDRILLESVLQNLLENAIKYRKRTDNDRVDIRIGKWLNGIRLEVTDNGIGIPEKSRDHVFRMFFRATEKISGTGLGLYMVKNCVNLLGGTIALEETAEKETRFTVYLPSL